MLVVERKRNRQRLRGKWPDAGLLLMTSHDWLLSPWRVMGWRRMAENGSLSANQRKAIIALLNASTVREAAEAAGLGERTLARYLSSDKFRAELCKRQDEALAAATAALSGLTGAAVGVLADVMNDPNASHSARVRAALGILSERRKVAELDDLVERVAALENAQRVR